MKARRKSAEIADSWSHYLNHRPIVVALAGPNGAGKSTFFEAHLKCHGLRFLNAVNPTGTFLASATTVNSSFNNMGCQHEPAQVDACRGKRGFRTRKAWNVRQNGIFYGLTPFTFTPVSIPAPHLRKLLRRGEEAVGTEFMCSLSAVQKLPGRIRSSRLSHRACLARRCGLFLIPESDPRAARLRIAER